MQRCGITLLGHISCHVVIANSPLASGETEGLCDAESTSMDGGSDMEIDTRSQDGASVESFPALQESGHSPDSDTSTGSKQCPASNDPKHICWQVPGPAHVTGDLLHVSRLHGLNAQLCSNCKDKESLTREVIMSVNRLSVDDYQVLTDRGWFRRGSKPLYQYRYVHKSHCGTYDTRTDVRRFDASLSKTYRRVLKRCLRANVQVETVEPAFRQDAYELYNSYQVTKHDKPRKTPDGYRAHAIDSPIQPCRRGGVRYGTVNQLYWMDGCLIGVGVIDVLPHTLISVYMYYDVARPVVGHLSLGVYAALQEIGYAQHLNKTQGANIAYYTMGGFSPLNDKLSYKARYKPVQYLASWASSLWMDSLQTCYILAELNHVRQQLRALKLNATEQAQKAVALQMLSGDICILPTPTSQSLHGQPQPPRPVTVCHLVEAVLEAPVKSGIGRSTPSTLGGFLQLLQKNLPAAVGSKMAIFPEMAASSGKSSGHCADNDGRSNLFVTPETLLDVETLYRGLVDHSQTTGNTELITFRLPGGQQAHFKELSSCSHPLTNVSSEILHHSAAALASGLGETVASRTIVDLPWITCTHATGLFDTPV